MQWIKSFLQARKNLVVFFTAILLSFGLMALGPENKVALARLVSLSTVRAGHWVFSWLIDLYGVRDENRTLREQNLRLSLELLKLREERLENLRLRGLLRFKTGLTAPYVPAEVIARNPGRIANSVMINVGRRDGVEARMAVVTADGLVGKILNASSESAVVQLLLDRDCRVSGVVQRSDRAQGIVRYDDGRLLLQGAPIWSDIQVGDVVVSSGMGGIFPAGLQIGTVETVGHDATGLFREVVLKPSVDYTSLEEVFVLQTGRNPVPSLENP